MRSFALLSTLFFIFHLTSIEKCVGRTGSAGVPPIAPEESAELIADPVVVTPPNEDETVPVAADAGDVDARIRSLQIDALLCAAAPMIHKIPDGTRKIRLLACALESTSSAIELYRTWSHCSIVLAKKPHYTWQDELECLKMTAVFYGGAHADVFEKCAGSEHDLKAQYGGPFMKNVEKIGLWGAIISCSATVVQEVDLLIQLTRDADKKIAEAQQSQLEAVNQFVNSDKFGDRLRNWGLYQGCRFATNDGVIDKTEDPNTKKRDATWLKPKVDNNLAPNPDPVKDTEKKCIRLCEKSKAVGNGAHFGLLTSPQQDKFMESCTFACKNIEYTTAWDTALFTSAGNVVTRDGCKAFVEAANSSAPKKAKTMFRLLPFKTVNDPSLPYSFRELELLRWAGKINFALEVILDNWDKLKPKQSFVSTLDIVNLATKLTAELALDFNKLSEDKIAVKRGEINALKDIFQNKDFGIFRVAGPIDIPVFAALLDSTQDGRVDGWVSKEDIEAFRSEITQYYFGRRPAPAQPPM